MLNPALPENGLVRKILDKGSDPVGITNGILKLWASASGDRSSLFSLLLDLGVRAILPRGDHQGPLCGLSANKDFFSFSIRIKDEAVRDNTGSPCFRNFSLLDVHGEPVEDADLLEIEGDLEDEERELLRSGSWVLPERWEEYKSDRYILSKLAIGALTARAAWLRSEKNRLLGLGYNLPQTPSLPRVRQAVSSVTVNTLEAEVFYETPFFELTSYPPVEESDAGLAAVRDLYNLLTYTLIPKIRYHTRLIEYALHRHQQHHPLEGFMDDPDRRLWRVQEVYNDGDTIAGVRYRVFSKKAQIFSGLEGEE